MLLDMGRLLAAEAAAGVLRIGLAFLRGAAVVRVLGWAALLAQGGADSNVKCQFPGQAICIYNLRLLGGAPEQILTTWLL